MKSFIIAILLFTIFISATVINSFYILGRCETISSYADGIRLSHSTPHELNGYWQRHRTYFGLSVSEAKIERMDELIISLFAATDERNSYETVRICRLISALAKDICANERISLQGIL